METLAKLIARMEGFVPEAFLIFMITFSFLLVLFAREYLKHITPPEYMTLNMNSMAYMLSLTSLVSYWILLLNSPVSFRTPFGLYSDGVIYTFRVSFVFIFLIYFFYIFYEARQSMFYTFEYYFVLLSAMLGLSCMTIASNFFNLLIFMELYAFSVYYLIQEKRSSARTAEAAMKYFTISSFSTALYLFGLFLVYFSTAGLGYCDASILAAVVNPVGVLGYQFILLSLCIKIGAGLFFFWVTDPYEGTSFCILMFLNLFVKPVFIFVFFKILIFSGCPTVFWVYKHLLFCSIIVGAFGATSYTKIKKFLIFTSIYNIGFFTCFFWDPSSYMLGAFVFYFFVYTLNSFGLMMLIGMLRDGETKRFLIVDLKDLSGIMPQSVPLAIGLIFFLLALSGLPPFSFFFAKYYLFIKFFTDATWLYVLILLLASAVSTFNYVRIARIILGGWKPTFFLIVESRMVTFLVSAIVTFNIFFLLFADKILDGLNFIIDWC